jgi:hypothetical protein
MGPHRQGKLKKVTLNASKSSKGEIHVVTPSIGGKKKTIEETMGSHRQGKLKKMELRGK